MLYLSFSSDQGMSGLRRGHKISKIPSLLSFEVCFVNSRAFSWTSLNANIFYVLWFLFIAEHQANLLEQLKSSFPLTDKEKQILSRGRNAVTKSKNRRNPAAYQDSTAFEAYIGYLYISDQSRCAEVFKWLDEKVDMVES
jgi:hypothetical protein